MDSDKTEGSATQSMATVTMVEETIAITHCTEPQRDDKMRSGCLINTTEKNILANDLEAQYFTVEDVRYSC